MKKKSRQQRPERRLQVAKAILKIIGEKGLTTLTTATLAKEVGVTSGALFRHFETRDEMMEEAANYAIQKIEETFPEKSLAPMQRILQLARRRIQTIGDEPGMAWMLRSEQAYLTLPKQAVAKLRNMVKRSRDFLLKAIRDGANQGSIRKDIKPEILLVFIVGAIHSLTGMKGIPGQKAVGERPNPGTILSGLEAILAPSEGMPGNKHKTKKRSFT